MREPLALTRIRQDVSAGKCVTGMIPPPRQDTSYSPKVISASAAIANLLHRARMPWILEHLCDSWLWDTPKIQSLSAQPRTVWALADFCVLGSQSRKRRWFLVGNVDSRRFAPYCSQVKQVDVAVCLDRNMFLQVLPHHAQIFAHHVTTHAPRRFQRTHPLSGMGSALNASKDILILSTCETSHLPSDLFS